MLLQQGAQAVARSFLPWQLWAQTLSRLRWLLLWLLDLSVWLLSQLPVVRQSQRLPLGRFQRSFAGLVWVETLREGMIQSRGWRD